MFKFATNFLFILLFLIIINFGKLSINKQTFKKNSREKSFTTLFAKLFEKFSIFCEYLDIRTNSYIYVTDKKTTVAISRLTK